MDQIRLRLARGGDHAVDREIRLRGGGGSDADRGVGLADER